MQNQVATQETQQLTVKQEKLSLAIAKVGKLTETAFIKKVIDLKPIRKYDLDNDDDKLYLSQGLSMIFIKVANLTGIKDPISDINKRDISEMIVRFFKNLSLEEIDYAFKMERYGMLEPKSEHYQLFNAEYVSEILNKYKKFRHKVRVQLDLPIAKIEKPKELSEEDKEFIVINGVLNCFENFKQTKSIEIGSLYVYDYLFELGALPFHSKRFKSKIKRKAIREIYKSRNNFSSIKDKRLVKNILISIQNNENPVRTKCQELILIEFFSRVINTNQSFTDLLSKLRTQKLNPNNEQTK